MDKRSKKILYIIIGEYLKMPLPVGSKQVAEKYGLSASSIRSWMVPLEKNGYLKRVYSSSGRIPTDKALRFYINELLEAQDVIFRKRERIKN